MMMTLAAGAAMLPPRGCRRPALAVERVHSDTRTLQPGDLFVALKGERFDAHDFLAAGEGERRGRGAGRARPAEAGRPALQVADTQQALRLARAWRRRFELPLIAVAGSNGKTTVTQMVAVDPARLARRRRAGDARQLQQPHRRAADLARCGKTTRSGTAPR